MKMHFITLVVLAALTLSASSALADRAVVGAVGHCEVASGSATTHRDGYIQPTSALGTYLVCAVPSNTALDHRDFRDVRVNGFSSTLGIALEFCRKFWNGGGEFCTNPQILANGSSGSFQAMLPVGSAWSNANSFPFIRLFMANGDRIYGFHLLD